MLSSINCIINSRVSLDLIAAIVVIALMCLCLISMRCSWQLFIYELQMVTCITCNNYFRLFSDIIDCLE